MSLSGIIITMVEIYVTPISYVMHHSHEKYSHMLCAFVCDGMDNATTFGLPIACPPPMNVHAPLLHYLGNLNIN